MINTFFEGKLGEYRTMRAGCRCENMVFVRFLPVGLPQSGKLSVLSLLAGQISTFLPTALPSSWCCTTSKAVQ